jgi:uncharacterized membrane protein
MSIDDAGPLQTRDAGTLRPEVAPAPRAKADRRILGLDVARSIALIGMVATHIFPMVDQNDGTPSLAWELFAGRAMALFIVVAGIGLAISSGGARPPAPGERSGVAAAIATRAVLLTIIGLALGQVVTRTYVILPFYGVMFLLAVPLLRLSPRRLVGVAAATTIAAPVLMQGVRDSLPFPSYTPGGEYVNPTFGSLAHPGRLLSELFLTGVYPALPLMVYICVGIALGRLLVGVAASNRSALPAVACRLFLGGIVLALLASWGSSLLLHQAHGLDHIREASTNLDDEQINDVLVWGPDPTLPTTTWWWLAIKAPHSSTPLDLMHTVGTSVAAVGGSVLLGMMARRTIRPLATAGTMTLSLYCLHVLATQTYLIHAAMVWFLVQLGAAGTFAILWQRRFGQGPLERVVAEVASSAKALVVRAPRST